MILPSSRSLPPRFLLTFRPTEPLKFSELLPRHLRIDRRNRSVAEQYDLVQGVLRRPCYAYARAHILGGLSMNRHFSRSLSPLFFGLILACLVILLLPACSVNVKKEGNGQDKQVDIKTLLGGIHVSKGADLADVGLALYPGATPKPEDNGDDKSANVNISGFGFGLKVVALEYQSSDKPDKVIAFYQDQLKKYGNVLVCHTARHFEYNSKGVHHDSHELTCDSSSGSNVELKVGTDENQHIVAVEPDGSGSTFSLVYIRTHGKDSEI